MPRPSLHFTHSTESEFAMPEQDISLEDVRRVLKEELQPFATALEDLKNEVKDIRNNATNSATKQDIASLRQEMEARDSVYYRKDLLDERQRNTEKMIGRLEASIRDDMKVQGVDIGGIKTRQEGLGMKTLLFIATSTGIITSILTLIVTTIYYFVTIHH